MASIAYVAPMYGETWRPIYCGLNRTDNHLRMTIKRAEELRENLDRAIRDWEKWRDDLEEREEGDATAC